MAGVYMTAAVMSVTKVQNSSRRLAMHHPDGQTAFSGLQALCAGFEDQIERGSLRRVAGSTMPVIWRAKRALDEAKYMPPRKERMDRFARNDGSALGVAAIGLPLLLSSHLAHVWPAWCWSAPERRSRPNPSSGAKISLV
jgi:hypothetical protein